MKPNTTPAVAIKRLFRVVNGSTPKSGEEDFWNGSIAWATPEDLGRLTSSKLMTTRRKLTPRGLASCGASVVRRGSLVLSTRAPIGHVAIAGVEVSTNQGCRSLEPLRPGKVDSRFFYYLLLAFGEELRANGKGTTFMELSSTDLGCIKVPSPTVSTQRAIADFLDRRTQAIDELIRKKERLIELLQEKRQALITQAVTKGLDLSVPMKDSGVPWLGEIPAHWEVVALKRFARKGYKTFTDGDWIEAPFITDAGVRLIQTGNVGIGEYREKGFRYISQSTFSVLRCTEVMPNDVLICRLDGPVGRACLAPDLGSRMITSVDNAILKPGSDVDPRFLVYVLSEPHYLEWVQSLCRVGGGHRLRVSRTMLGDFMLPKPPGDEQERIADMLDLETRSISALEVKLGRQLLLLSEYRQALISAAVTGEIDVAEEAAA